MSEAQPNPDRLDIGRFELLEKIGQGGMSAVFKARDLTSRDIVAVKIASHAVVNDPQLSRRFELEYALAQPLTHRNLVKVLGAGKHQEVPFLVMEYIDGPSLAKHIATQGCLREHEALSLLLPVADALTYLHRRQIVHRDIKPGNILISSQGQVKLADLGLVKDLGSMSQLTRTNMGLGTIQFASPEQFDDAATSDARSDVYSLAATLYAALTGENPFGKGTTSQIVQRKLLNQFEAPIQKLPKLRPAVDAAIRLGMHAERDRRPESVSEFVAYLTGWKKVPADIALPGKVTHVDAPTRMPKKTTHERRTSARYEIEIASDCRTALGAASQRWASTIVDISTTGVCLQSSRRFEPGSLVEVVFSTQSDDSAVTHLTRVRWNKETDSDSWLHGCEFVQPISDDDLETVFSGLMDHTTAHQN